ncbi:MAG: glycosyltransferase [Oscillospiraceae bacterium]|nr:glycosyltransferase [Oscillospiraceae bacterium]
MNEAASNNSSYLISIIIPVYNSESFLSSRLEQLLKNNLENIQIIIINDGSTDKSLEICKQYFDKNPHAIIINQENQGLSAARNTGIDTASGQYIVFLDSDDILITKGFDEIRKHLENDKPDVLMGKYVIMQEKGRRILPKYTFPKIKSADEARLAIYSRIHDSVWYVWRYISRREFLLENELYFVRGIVCEDMEWTPRLLTAAKTITFVDEPFYGYYYKRVGSVTQTAAVRRLRDVNALVAADVDAYIDEFHGKALINRLIKESFFSISRYCLCGPDNRKALLPVINEAIRTYRYSSSIIIRFFAFIRNFLPLFICSVLLTIVRLVLGTINRLLGPLSVKHRAWEY